MNENGKNNLNIPNVKLVEIEDKNLEIPETKEYGLTRAIIKSISWPWRSN